MSEHAVLNRELRQKVEMSSETVTNADIMQLMRQVIVSVDTLEGKVDTLRSDMDARFKEVDARFDRVDDKFREVDARFNKVDAKFVEVQAEQHSIKLAQQGLSQEVRSMKTTSWIVCMGTLAAMALFIIGAWYQNQTSADRYREFELMIQAQMFAPAPRQTVPQIPVQLYIPQAEPKSR